MIVEGHARRDHVQHYGSAMCNRGLQHREQLLLVAGEGAGDEGRTHLDRQCTGVDRWQVVQDSSLKFRAKVGRGGELSLSETVNAVVFDDVDDRQIATHHVDELSQTNGGTVAIATYA